MFDVCTRLLTRSRCAEVHTDYADGVSVLRLRSDPVTKRVVLTPSLQQRQDGIGLRRVIDARAGLLAPLEATVT